MNMPRLNANTRFDVDRLDTIEKCDASIKNATRLGKLEWVQIVQAKRKQLRGQLYPNDNIDLVDDALTGLDLYEAVKSVATNRNYYAAKTRRGLNKHGVTEFIKRRVAGNHAEQGFQALNSSQLREYTSEFLVLKHRHLFDAESIRMAEEFVARLD
jgi:hypothetical protein